MSYINASMFRLVSYFLRHSTFIKGRYPTGIEAEKETPGDAVYIKSGGLVDPSCSVAKALLLADVVSLPMADTRLRLLPGEAIPYQLLPAVFNGSVVGVARVCRSTQLCEHKCQESRPIPLTLRQLDADPLWFEINIDEHQCSECPSFQLLRPCESLSVCRVVDVLHRMYHIILPVKAHLGGLVGSGNSKATHYNSCLLKGSMQLPTVMTHIANFPFHPYLSGDSVGEGSSAMKGRSNVKRRAAGRN